MSSHTAPTFSWGVRTDVGRVREINQDSVHARDGLFVVADGMGGHSGGEVASAVAVEVFADDDVPVDIETLIDRVRVAHAEILERAAAEPRLRGMGTTLCAIAKLDNDRIGLVNVGDSRIYLFAGDELQQISEDHSLVGELHRAGHLTEDEVATHPQRNIVTRALGIGDELLVDYWELPARTGDRFLLCSDGLVDEVADNQIAAALRRLDDPAQAVDELVRLANESGSRDNVSVLLVQVDDGADGATALALAPQVDVPFRDAGDAAAPAAAPEPVGSSRGTDRLVEARAPLHEELDGPREKVRLPRRGLLIGAMTVMILIAAFWVTALYARNNYYVGFEQDQVVIYQGRPGGVLWFDPTREEASSLVRDALNPALTLEVERNPEFDSINDAREYVDGLAERADEANAIDPATGDG